MVFLTMGLFLAYGFLVIYLLYFASGKNGWLKLYLIGKHFETRMALFYGNLFTFLNMLIGYLPLHFRDKLQNAKAMYWLAFNGLLMPIGIFTAVYFGLLVALALIVKIVMTASMIWLGVAFLKIKFFTQ